jgi:predicted GNAT family acetyltransferase
MGSGEPRVVDRPEEHRFVVETDGEEAELVYRHLGQRLVLRHTGVPEAVGGRGIGGVLVRAAVEKATAEGLTVVPVCPYAAKWLRTHPEVASKVAIEW